MAWGKSGATGLDDLCQRLASNDAKLASLTVLKHRKFDAVEVRKLCKALVGNTVLRELYASNHSVSPEVAAEIGEMLASNATLTSICIGDSSLGDEGVAALSKGLTASRSLQALDLEGKVSPCMHVEGRTYARAMWKHPCGSISATFAGHHCRRSTDDLRRAGRERPPRLLGPREQSAWGRR
jgi:hypothetical protein